MDTNQNEISQNTMLVEAPDDGEHAALDFAKSSISQVLANQYSHTEFMNKIRMAGPFKEALQITIRPPRPRREVIAALRRYVLELCAAEQAEWDANPVVGAVTGYSITRRFTEVDPTDGIVKERVRSILLLKPNPLGTRRNGWLNSVYWPNLSCDIDGNHYFRRNIFIELSVVKEAAPIALEIDTALADEPNLWALGEFNGRGFDSMWIKPSKGK